MRFHRICENCAKHFYDYPSNRVRFCSLVCSVKFRVGKNAANYQGGGVVICKQCSKQIIVTPGQAKTKRFCSMHCYAASKKGKLTHSMEFYRQLGEKQRGPLNHNWKGGREHSRQVARIWIRNHMVSVRIRNALRRARHRNATGSFTLMEWEGLKRRYSYKCLACGKREPDIRLTIDHVIPLIKGGSHNITNIQPLCQP